MVQVVKVNHSVAPDAVVYYGSSSWVNNVNYTGPTLPSDVFGNVPNRTDFEMISDYSRESFREVIRSGRIKMTDYSHLKESYPVLSGVSQSIDYENRAAVVAVPKNGYWTHVRTDRQFGSYELSVAVEENETIDPQYDFSIDDTLPSVMQKVVDDSLTTYDLLTEVSELAETLRYIVSLLDKVNRPLKSFADKRENLLRSGRPRELVLQDIANLWLEYRYAIMPIVYSIQDVASIYEDSTAMFVTKRAQRPSKVINPDLTDVPPEVLYRYASMSIMNRATGKTKYLVSDLMGNMYALLGINPFVTAWELTTFSFVIDWFINIGDTIQNLTYNLWDFSLDRGFCYSIRTNGETITGYDFVRPKYNSVTGYHPNGQVAWTFPEVSEQSFQLTVLRHKQNNYVRKVFLPSDIPLVLSLPDYWKQILDGIALSLNPTLKSLRRLKR
uniref:Uncharacterized protein n=1 Tax=Beihai levi-like virus 20 TaxID=1922406 RepID=A0A1L3KI21_9VIRU|nr:hypothetical protein [Beihai levi-like virus 20]